MHVPFVDAEQYVWPVQVFPRFTVLVYVFEWSVADVDFIVQDIVDALTSEEDAYRAGFSASKKFKRQNYIVINDAIPELYQSLAKVVTNKF